VDFIVLRFEFDGTAIEHFPKAERREPPNDTQTPPLIDT
jgi:hypothetical protein